MEISTRPTHETENPSRMNSPKSNGSSSSNSNNGPGPGPGPAAAPPLTPNTISRSETNPDPTTFVQADTSTFKQVVQMLTGSSETAKQASQQPHSDPSLSRGFIPPVKTCQQKKQGFRLYERRNTVKNGLMINPLLPALAHNSGFSPRKPEILSPSILDFPSLALSPVTPLIQDPFHKSSPSLGSSSEEEKAIADKKFYFYPSPRTTPRGSEPQLLPLFPVTSPRVSGSSS